MRTLLAFALALFAAAPVQAQPVGPANRAQINALLTRWEKAWEDGDAAAWSRVFQENGTWILWTGGEWRGRAEIAAKFAAPLATVYKDSVQRIRLVETRQLAPNVIVARIRSTTVGDTRQPGVTIHGNKLLVLTRRRGGRWLILYGQNTRLDAVEIAKLGPGQAR